MDKVKTEHWVVWAIFFLVLVMATFLRLQNLGEFSFHVDELNHVVGAKSMLENGEPTLPSGIPYERAWLFTWMVSEVFRILPANETTARIPTVVANLLFIIVLFVVCKTWFGNRIAIVAAFLAAFSPLDILMSRFCRMYTPFELSYFMGVVCLYFSTETQRTIRKRLVFLGISGIIFLISYHLQSLTVTVVFAFGAFVLLMSVREKEYRIWAGLGALVVLFMLFQGELLFSLYQKATSAPAWSGETEYLYEVRYMISQYTWLVPFYLIGVVSSIYVFGRKAIFLACQFIIPMLVAMFIFLAQAPRYSFHLYPFFFITTAIGIVHVLEWSYRKVKIILSYNIGIPLSYKKVLVTVISSLVIVLSFLTTDWIQEAYTIGTNKTYKVPKTIPLTLVHNLLEKFNLVEADESFEIKERKAYRVMGLAFPEWSEAKKYLETRIKPDDIVVASLPLSVHYYLGNVTYTTNPGLSDSLRKKKLENGEIVYIDKYVGSIYLSTVQEVRALVKNNNRGWFIVHRAPFFRGGGITPRNDIGKFLLENLKYKELVVKGELVIFSWGVEDFYS